MPNKVAQGRLDQMMRGKHPVTGAFLGLPVEIGSPAEAMWVDLAAPFPDEGGVGLPVAA